MCNDCKNDPSRIAWLRLQEIRRELISDSERITRELDHVERTIELLEHTLGIIAIKGGF